ncbi:hypothetical protein BO82DRAFT_421440 [Aspergillus uvarum CBS 121591]|uniref:Uncharacterized protein n=1 Tax=Aspergillus uvarum CBS 121591 TaxID=1448315 RepID=A0A319CSS8_9EURO|nr:hypothetical protein BO82DRAFT_421440 [Aspergillus uvarum CBS 121591]PYH78628.1 hypothetical protein BO82DRAFT_421440 [Aspergillus uvarum CBS 121591]
MTQIYILINQIAVLVFTLIMTTNLAPPIKRYLAAITGSSPLAAGLLLYCSVSYLINHGRCGLLVATYLAQLYSTIATDYLWNLLFWKTLPANGMWARALKDELSMRKDLFTRMRLQFLSNGVYGDETDPPGFWNGVNSDSKGSRVLPDRDKLDWIHDDLREDPREVCLPAMLSPVAT